MSLVKQSGFNVVPLVILGVIAIMGFVGWRLYESQRSKTETTASTASNTHGQKTAESEKYLVIKEWGVRIPLKSKTAQVTYTHDASGAFARLSTPRLDELSQQNAECSEANKSVSLVRIKLGDHYMGRALVESDISPTWVKIDDHYYYYAVGQPCFGGSQAVVAEIGDIRNALIDSIKLVQHG